ncbi:unnamed protein product [Phaedon cochleariae]|uniref:Golgin-84 n=1 Tax=Phaedon cochleariae TaxID=80249 RepID=A0A9P0DH11_PHACE|nr:unnamed protein product [Phaedon cochleariae]
MAWLQNLAGRAEDLLNKIDQNAATVLNEPNQKISDTENILVQEPVRDFIVNRQYDGRQNNEESHILASSVITSLNSQNSPFSEKDVQEKPEDLDSEIVSLDEQSKDSSVYEESIHDASLKILLKSDKLSSSSSLHNSFISAEESQHLQDRIAKLEFENQDLNKQLLNLTHVYSEQRNENANLQFQVERANEQLAEAHLEKHQYIARAQKILQDKEKLISLKQDNNIDQETKDVFAIYNEELKRELEFHQTKCEEQAQKNMQLLKEFQSLQMQHQVIQNGLQTTIQTLEYSLVNENKFRTIAEEDCLQKNKELLERNQEFSQVQDLLRVKDYEIHKLKEALRHKGTPSFNEDIESRIKSLTHTLMVKQNALETVTTERNALKLQFEKLESEFKKNLVQLQRFQVKVVNVEEQDDSVPLPKFMRVSPFDAGVTRRVKRAYSTLDAVSIRTGIFLRRYPVARVFVFCYMVLLHIWVLIILFWYAPNNH